jgi:SAM-dependent methyltransferase
MEKKEALEACIHALKKSKSYSALDEEAMRKSVLHVLTSEKTLAKRVSVAKSIRSKHFKDLLSRVKARLRKQALLYFAPEARFPSLNERKELPESILAEVSAAKPKRILDLGCGLNPLFFPFKEFDMEHYLAVDLNKEVIDKVNEFFRENLVPGEAVVADVKSLDFPEPYDVVFLLKILDLIDDSGHKNAEKLIRSLNSRIAIISFPTKTISGKSMTFSRRTWVEKMLRRLGRGFKIIKTENEVFYVVSLS